MTAAEHFLTLFFCLNYRSSMATVHCRPRNGSTDCFVRLYIHPLNCYTVKQPRFVLLESCPRFSPAPP